jgi:hypothetical protein
MLPTAHGMYAKSLVNQNRVQEGLAEFERALALLLDVEGPNSFETASAFGIVGMLREELGDYAKADEAFSNSVKSYDAAMLARPGDVGERAENIRLVFSRVAALKRRLGQEAAARALEVRIAGLPAASAPAAAAPLEPEPPPSKVIGAIPCFGSFGIRLTEDDVRQIRSGLPAGSQLWFIVSERQFPGRVERLNVEVYLRPDVDTPDLRRGRIVWVTGDLQGPDAFGGKTAWRSVGVAFDYVQMPAAGSDPAGAWLARPTRPIKITSFDRARPFTNAEIQSVIRFVRMAAAKTSKANTPPRLFSDLQPWIITAVTRDLDGTVRVSLANPDPSGPRGQMALLKPSGSSWAVMQLSER